MRYHKKFTRIKQDVRDITEQFFQSKPFRGPNSDKQAKFEEWLQRVSEAYGVPTPALIVIPDTHALRQGAHGADGEVIQLPAYSVILLFHCFRHHLQFHQQDQDHPSLVGQLAEHDAHGWGCSLYHSVRPIMFASAVRKGNVWGMQPSDLHVEDAPLDADTQREFERIAGAIMEDVSDEFRTLVEGLED